MTIQPFTEDEQDALQELANVAMGQAGRSLSLLLDDYVALSVPLVRLVAAADAPATMANLVGYPKNVTAVRQGFYRGLRGEALTIFDGDGWRYLGDLVGEEGPVDDQTGHELVLEIANILVGAVLGGLGEQIGMEFSYSPPSILGLGQPVEEILVTEDLEWSHALLMEVNFSQEKRDFTCHLLALMPENSVTALRGELRAILEGL